MRQGTASLGSRKRLPGGQGGEAAALADGPGTRGGLQASSTRMHPPGWEAPSNVERLVFPRPTASHMLTWPMTLDNRVLGGQIDELRPTRTCFLGHSKWS